MLALFLIQIILQICLKGSLDRLWNLFFTMQIICYLVIYDIPLPANTDIYIIEFTKLIEFDILNPDGILRKITGDPDIKLVNLMTGLAKKKEGEPNMVDDFSFFIMIGIGAAATLCFVFCVYVLLKIFNNPERKEKLINFMLKMKRKVFFNTIIRSITIIYIQLCMSFGEQVEVALQGKSF